MSTSRSQPDPSPASPESGPARLGRRRFLVGGAVAGGALATGLAASSPALAAVDGSTGLAPTTRRTTHRRGPAVSSGVQAGDVGDHSATLWARADGPGRLWVEVLTGSGRRRGRRVRGPIVSEATDFTGQVVVRGLPSGERVRYRVWFEGSSGRSGEAEVGSFRTPGRHDRSARFLWTGDCAGQGWGINPASGGMVGFEAMRQEAPDFWVFSGDTVYADGPLVPQVALPDGSTWRNIVTPEKSKVAETLDEYRGQWRYNLLDENLRRLNAEVPVIVQWDDHEVTNNWFPGEVLTDAGGDARYSEKSVDVLAARAAQAFHEYFPMSPHRPGPVHRRISYGPLVDVFVLDMRTFRGPNTPGLETGGANTAILGAEQLAWIERELRRSRAVWKVIASDMPIGLIVPDGDVNIEAIANRDPGTPLGRELEAAALLASIARHRVRNVVWLTADVHYTAAHHYDPGRAAFTAFDPFWEFVAGPINAGTFGPNTLDPTFGPSAEFVEAALFANQPPSDGRQYYGVVEASRDALDVRLKNIAGATLYATRVTARR
jgi:alkaline phosphatase D